VILNPPPADPTQISEPVFLVIFVPTGKSPRVIRENLRVILGSIDEEPYLLPFDLGMENQEGIGAPALEN
jgi:hypothetical protein